MRQHMLLSILLMVVLTLLVFMGRHAAADAPNVNAMPSSDLSGVNDALASVEDAMRQTKIAADRPARQWLERMAADEAETRKEAEGPERRAKIATGPNANAMVTIDLIPNGGPGNQIDDGITLGTVSGQGTKIAVEVFAKGVTTSLVGLQIAFDFDASVLKFDKAENSAFRFILPLATGAAFAGTAPVTLPASGFIGRAEFSTVVDVTGRAFRLGIKRVRLAESAAAPTDRITTPNAISFNAAPSPDAASSPDFDGDGVVGIPDFLLFVDHFGTSRGDASYDAKYDLDGNGAIGIPDFLIFVDSFGKEVSTPNGGGGNTGIVDIPDANLRAAIASALGKASSALITPAEMATLTRLDAPNKGIRSLTGLEHATNLQSLDLGGEWGIGELVNSNNISNLSPLSNLINLTELGLEYNIISDVTPLSNLTNLTRLELDRNSISDITPLSNLTNLTLLDLHNTSLSDITPLSNLTNLTGLWLFSNSISDISTLANLTNLTNLDLRNTSLSDITPLSNLTNLTLLNLRNTSLSDITPLSNLTNLTLLNLHNTSLSDITPLSNLTNLTNLELSNNIISDVTPLSNLTNLTNLELDRNSLSDITPLSNLTNLTDLSLSFNSISDLAPLVANTGLGSGDEVDLRWNPLSATSLNTHIPALQSRGVVVRFSASKPGVKEIKRDRISEDREARTQIPYPTGGPREPAP